MYVFMLSHIVYSCCDKEPRFTGRIPLFSHDLQEARTYSYPDTAEVTNIQLYTHLVFIPSADLEEGLRGLHPKDLSSQRVVKLKICQARELSN